MRECIPHDVVAVFAIRRAPVARANPRLTAGVGLISAFLLLGGPGLAVAFGGPGGSHFGGSNDGDGPDRNWGGGPRIGSKHGADNDNGIGITIRRGADNNGSRRVADSPKTTNNDGPRTRVGSGRDDVQRLSPSNTADLSPADRSDASERQGSDRSSEPSAQFEPPRVTIGNGRTPTGPDTDREPNWNVVAPEAPEPLPPPPPPAIAPPDPSWVDRIYSPPVVAKQLAVTPTADLSDPMWGIAGLLLIPAAGAVLGYRQARAASQAAEILGRP
jgi:hypothetical protein